MLRWRLLSAGVILSILIGLMALDYGRFGAPILGLWILPFFLAVVAMATHECLALLAAQGMHPIRWPAFVGSLLVVLATYAATAIHHSDGTLTTQERWMALAWTSIAMAMALILTMAVYVSQYDGPARHLVHAALTMFTIAYVALPMSFLVVLRMFYNNQWGMTAVVSLLVVVKMSDVGAYFTGRMLGRRKLFPALSPGKTLEGTVGGVLASSVASWFFFMWIAPMIVGAQDYVRPAIMPTLVYGLVVGSLGVIGDLAESMFKRDSARKDSSNWLPGLGGVLDILDSVLLSAPAAYLFWGAGLLGPQTT
jgi:phosphatidate cytidylyltransferase